MLSVFLVYCVPATGAEPPVLLVAVNPAQSLPVPAAPSSVSDTPPMVSGSLGTNLPRI